MKVKWLGAKRTLRFWLLSGHVVSLTLCLGWRNQLKIAARHGFGTWLWYVVGCDFGGWEGGVQRDLWFGPFKLEWWTHAGSEDGRRYWDWVREAVGLNAD